MSDPHGPSGSLLTAEAFADAPAGSAESFAFELLTLSESGEEVLTAGEREALRAEILDSIVTAASPWRHYGPAMGVCILGAAAVSGYGALWGGRHFVLGGLFALVVSVVTVGVALRQEARASRLGRDERLAVIEALRSWGLIRGEEARELRSRLDGQQSASAAGPSTGGW